MDNLFALGNFHFAQMRWLWGLMALPLIVPLVLLLGRRAAAGSLLERFADKHLLPHLVRSRAGAARRLSWPLLLWSAAFTCGVLAMAGPRWSFTDTQTFAVPDDLVIVLDLSRTMNAQDAKPSRIMRAKQEIQDLLDLSRGAQIGLVAYAAVPHMVTPLTDDIRTIRNLLPELDTSLVTLQGDALKPALDMAATMLRAEPGQDKSILVISDGEFEETDIADLARAAGGATIYTMGIGTAAGVSGTGPGGEPIVSRLRADRLAALAAAGHGLYVEADYTDQDTRAILRRVEGDGGRAGASGGLGAGVGRGICLAGPGPRAVAAAVFPARRAVAASSVCRFRDAAGRAGARRHAGDGSRGQGRRQSFPDPGPAGACRL